MSSWRRLRANWSEKAEVYSAPSDQTVKAALRCYWNIVLLEGRGDHVKGVDLGRTLDKSCQRLQHFRVSICVVGIGIVLVIPETDCGYIDSAGTGKGNFVLKAVLSTKQGKDVLLKSSRVIRQHIGFQMK